MFVFGILRILFFFLCTYSYSGPLKPFDFEYFPYLNQNDQQ
jgi:hypothetical protein